MALAKVAARATEVVGGARWPSIDELASALRRGAGLPPAETSGEPPWPVLGLDATAHALLARVKALPAGGAIVLRGQAGSGRTTLARRLAWSLGVAGKPVALVDAPESLALELEQAPRGEALTVVVDDGDDLGPEAKGALKKALAAGAKLVWVGDGASALGVEAEPFVVSPLEEDAAAELVQRSVPSLPDALRAYLVKRVGGRPGALRAAVRELAGRVVVSKEDVDAALGTASRPSMAPLSAGRGQTIENAERALDMGRFDEAARGLEELGEARGADEDVRFGIVRARIALGRGDTARAMSDLKEVEGRPRERAPALLADGARAHPPARRRVRRGGEARAGGGRGRRDGHAVGGRAEHPRRRPRVHRGGHAGAGGARGGSSRGAGHGRAARRGRGPRLGGDRAPARRQDGRGARGVRGVARVGGEGAGRGDGRGDAAEPRGPGARRGAGAGARAPGGRGGHGAARGQRCGGHAGAAQPREPRPLPRPLGARPRLDRPARRGARGALARVARAAARPGSRARGADRGPRPRRGALRGDCEGVGGPGAHARRRGVTPRGPARAHARHRGRPARHAAGAVRDREGHGRAGAGRACGAGGARARRGGPPRGRRGRRAKGARSRHRARQEGRPARVGVAGARREGAPGGGPGRRGDRSPRHGERPRDARGDGGEAPAGPA